MPSTYDPLLRLELQATGENENTWGEKANDVFELTAQAIAGHVSVGAAGSGDLTLTTGNSVEDEARKAFITLSGLLTGNRAIIVPSSSKLYVFRRNTTGNFAITVKTASGAAVTLPASGFGMVACDGVDCWSVNNANNLTTDGGTINGAVVVSVSTSTSAVAALRITQTGAGPAILIEDAASDTTPFVVNRNGTVLIGTSVPYNIEDYVDNPLQIHVANYAAAPTFGTWNNSGPGPIAQFMKSRGAAVGTNAAVQEDDVLGQILFAGDYGSAFSDSARIVVQVDATVSSSIVPSRIAMQTMGSDGLYTSGFSLDKDGKVGIGTVNPQEQLHISSGNFRHNSAVMAAPSGSAPLFTARAWGVCASGAILNSGNLSGLVRNGAGDYTVTFTSFMPSVNYAPIIWGGHQVGYFHTVSRLESGLAVGSFRVQFMGWNGTTYEDVDPSLWGFAIFI